MRVSKKIFLTILSLVFLFSMSCGSNTDPNSGGGAENYPTSFGASVNNYTSQKSITVISESTSSKNATTGTIIFSVNGASDYTVSISSVEANAQSPVVFDASDFDYNKSTRELKLTDAGLKKFQNSSSKFTARTEYKYTIKFKFATSDKEANVDVEVNLIKGEIITKTEIESMIKQIKYPSDGIYAATKNGELGIDSSSGKHTKFDFSTATFNSAKPNYSATGKQVTTGSADYDAKLRAFSIASSIENTAKFKSYFDKHPSAQIGSIDYTSTPPSITSGSKDCTFTLIFKLKSGYGLASEVAHLTTTGLTIKLTLDANGTWK